VDAAALKVPRLQVGVDYCVLDGHYCDWAVEWMLLPCSGHAMLKF